MEDRIEQLIDEAQALEIRLRACLRGSPWELDDPRLDRLVRACSHATNRAVRRIGTYFEATGPFAPV